MNRGVFVTGTDTGVGKTVVCACLVRAWGADYWKPVQTGLDEEPGDTAVVQQLAGLPDERLHAPGYAFGPAVSPHLAADLAGLEITLERLALPMSPRPIVVEGAGGALVPLNGRALMIDLMRALGLPVIVVAADRLGAINHALLTLEALAARDLNVAGVILTGGPFADNAAAIECAGQTRLLARLPQADPIDRDLIERWASLAPRPADLAPA
jgi:malonyl-CoA O-methyltransferase